MADHCETVWRLLDFARSGHKLPVAALDVELGTSQLAAAAVSYATQAVERAENLAKVLPDTKQKVIEKGATMSTVPVNEVFPLPNEAINVFLTKLPIAGLTAATVHQLASKILSIPGRWFFWTKSDLFKKMIAQTLRNEGCKEIPHFAAFVACASLSACGLGRLVKSLKAAGGGRDIYFFEKRAVTDSLAPRLAVFGISPTTTPSLHDYSVNVASETTPPSRAPPIEPNVDWDDALAEAALKIFNGVAPTQLTQLAVPFAAPVGDLQEEPLFAGDVDSREGFGS